VDVVVPFGAIFWIPFLFLFVLKIKMLYKRFFIYHIVAFAIIYPVGIIALNNFDSLYLVFNLFQMLMIFMGLTFCLLGIKQVTKLHV
jgi:hypothetical protein